MIRFEPIEGGTYKVSKEVDYGLRAIFRRGEMVTVESVSPDPDDPESRFLVTCEKIGKKVRLRADDLECPHEFDPLPDGTNMCRQCGANFTALGTRLPLLDDTCAECGSQLSRQALACSICATATPWAMRQKILADEARETRNRPDSAIHTGGAWGTASTGTDVLGAVFDILTGW